MLEGLVTTEHSLARSHYWLTRGLLAAEFPPWPSPPLLSQPGPPWLPRWAHVDASLSADAGSTWPSDHQDSPPQVIPQNLPPSSWITRARHDSRQQWEPQSELETRPARHSWLWPALREREKQLIGNVYLTGDTPTGFYKANNRRYIVNMLIMKTKYFPPIDLVSAEVKMWNASRFCVSSLRRGHANLLCIVPILVYVLPKQVQE